MTGSGGREGRAGIEGMAGKAGIEGMLLCAAFHASVERRLMVPPMFSMVVMEGFRDGGRIRVSWRAEVVME